MSREGGNTSATVLVQISERTKRAAARLSEQTLTSEGSIVQHQLASSPVASYSTTMPPFGAINLPGIAREGPLDEYQANQNEFGPDGRSFYYHKVSCVCCGVVVLWCCGGGVHPMLIISHYSSRCGR